MPASASFTARNRPAWPLPITIASNFRTATFPLQALPSRREARRPPARPSSNPVADGLSQDGEGRRAENLLAEPFDVADAEATIATNLLGPIRLTAALLPHLRKRARATIINVTSGMAFAPLAATPT